MVLLPATFFIVPNTTFLHILADKRIRYKDDKRFSIPSIVECINAIKLIKVDKVYFEEVT